MSHRAGDRAVGAGPPDRGGERLQGEPGDPAAGVDRGVCERASTRCVLPVPDGPVTARFSARPIHSSVANAPSPKITRADLIVVDDIGMLPAGQAAAEALYRVIDAAYERRSVAVTSNLHPSGFDTIMPKTLATATVDRLLHHAHVVLTEGTSLRLAEATAGKRVIPLT